jgi:tetratricopeptide (TPR) repeat protein
MRFLATAVSVLVCSLAVVLVPSFASSPEWHLVDPLTQPGWQHFYNNEFEEAILDFQKEVDGRPDDPEAWNHLAQGILYREMDRNGALESQLVTGNNPFLRRAKLEISPDVKARFLNALAKATTLAESELQQNARSTHALYALSVVHGLRSNYLFLVEKAWIDALKEASTARKYSNKILEIDPNFVDTNVVQGLDNYIVGSLPFYMRALGFVAGVHGDREVGIKQLQEVAQRGVLSKWDAHILLAAIYRRERRSQDAIPLVKDLDNRFPRNYLFPLELVQMYSDVGNKTAALAVLSDVELRKNGGQAGYQQLPSEKICYLRGNLLFWYDDFEGALTNLRRATANPESLDLGTAQLAWFRQGQTLDLLNRHQEAIQAYQEAAKVSAQSDIGAEARGYISNPYHRKMIHNGPENPG